MSSEPKSAPLPYRPEIGGWPSLPLHSALGLPHPGRVLCDRVGVLTFGRPATSAFVRVNIGAQNRVHAREMAFALSLEPLEHVAVKAQMHGGLATRHNYPGNSCPQATSQKRQARTPLILVDTMNYNKN